ncbi:MAG: rRNA pseudouridine synthase [Clostridia bacterium]|nr:rRNA pseudouridine synthase [Clostridia bacterium]MDE7191651.1 rRNA pseudouridine synthase [Clostridia bacterium]
MERLNKYLASTGAASRRGADKLIEEGRVKVNGKVVKELGVSINEKNDTVMVDDKVVKPTNDYAYILFYKPKGCITTVSDEKGRKTIYDYLQDLNIPHLIPVGRLDYDTEGMLIMTNDGDMAYKLTHPSYEIPKTYLVKVEGEMPEHKLAQLRKGVIVDGEKTKRCKVKLLEYKDGESKLQVTITEGKNRQIRKMFEAVEREVKFLKRIAVGELRLGGLPRGGYRYLNDDEIYYLKNM